ncbi:hypothetical protein [Romboutsia sp.]|uniref:hypothetical protein n=1 Tax=Romboutsia sp. TaxID=1965302 RepID=UPI002C7F295E|nr:hypothetical protein [Romboutsia sp.]HSQ89787.1 hypothetical protein [Romboutsia sp.]
MYNLGRDFDMVFHHQRNTNERRFFLAQHEEKPEDVIPMEEEHIEDVTNKVIVSIECGDVDPDSGLPEIKAILVPTKNDRLVKHHEIGDYMLWFNLYREDKLIATFVKSDEPFIDTVDEYIKHYEETQGEVEFSKEDLIRLINYYIKGHSQDIYLKDYKEEDILIAVGL